MKIQFWTPEESAIVKELYERVDIDPYQGGVILWALPIIQDLLERVEALELAKSPHAQPEGVSAAPIQTSYGFERLPCCEHALSMHRPDETHEYRYKCVALGCTCKGR